MSLLLRHHGPATKQGGRLEGIPRLYLYPASLCQEWVHEAAVWLDVASMRC